MNQTVIRLLWTCATARKAREETARRTGVYSDVHDGSRTVSTSRFPAVVACPKKSTLPAVRYWLYACLALVLLMVFIGGLTRLTESGLSIVEWKVVSGTLPPMTQAAWEKEFAAYRASPQYLKVNARMTLADFKHIFWLEYLHRLLGRAVGLVFFLPFVGFLVHDAWHRKLAPSIGRGLESGRTPHPMIRSSDDPHSPDGSSDHRVIGSSQPAPLPSSPLRGDGLLLPRWLALRMGFFIVLVGLQGLAGWHMVKSGLVNDPWVDPLRLALHLGLAIALFGGLVVTMLQSGEWRGTAPSPAGGGLGWGHELRDLSTHAPLLSSPLRGEGFFPRLAAHHYLLSLLITALLILQMLMGALVAGLDAGLTYNTFPLMDGRVVPAGFHSLTPWYLNHVENIATVQFQHRWLAFALLALMLWQHLRLKAFSGHPVISRLRIYLPATVVIQVALGILTLLYVVPIPLAALHQMTAFLLLNFCLRLNYLLHSTKSSH